MFSRFKPLQNNWIWIFSYVRVCGTGEIDCWVKALATKPDWYLSVIPGTHTVEGNKWSLHTCGTHRPRCIHTQYIHFKERLITVLINYPSRNFSLRLISLWGPQDAFVSSPCLHSHCASRFHTTPRKTFWKELAKNAPRSRSEQLKIGSAQAIPSL